MSDKDIKPIIENAELLGVRQETMDKDYPMPTTIEEPPYVGKWAVLSYFVPRDLMHPDDQNRYINKIRTGESLYICIAEIDGWAIIENNKGESFRVNPKRILWVPKPEFELSCEIYTVNGTRRVGRICGRVWHYKEKKYEYYIQIDTGNGPKRHKKRYWASDFKVINS